MHDFFYFVDNTTPGLSGCDLLRLARLRPQQVPSPEEQRRQDIGTDQGHS